ncbi:MAG: hypothetical protein ACR2H5_15375 [Ktedonobacteraceae bacterium]
MSHERDFYGGLIARDSSCKVSGTVSGWQVAVGIAQIVLLGLPTFLVVE